MSYAIVEDIDASTAQAQEVGARVVEVATEIGSGKFSIIINPQTADIVHWLFGEGEYDKI